MTMVLFTLLISFFFFIHCTIIRIYLKVTILPSHSYLKGFTHQIYVKLHVLNNYRELGIMSLRKYFFSICAGCFDALNPEKLPHAPTCCESCDLRASCNLPSIMKEITLFHAMIQHEIWITKTDSCGVNRKHDWGLVLQIAALLPRYHQPSPSHTAQEVVSS